MDQKAVRLWSKDFILIIVINFLVFLNHLMVLATFPFYVESLGGSAAVAGSLISAVGYGRMFVIMAAFNVLAVLIYVRFGRTHPSSFTYRRKHGLL